jgi:hypothetical protein
MRQNRKGPTGTVIAACRNGLKLLAWWKQSSGAQVVVEAQADLLKIVGALHAPRRLARHLHRRQQERDQDADDRNHDQKFNEGKPRSGISVWGLGIEGDESMTSLHDSYLASEVDDRPIESTFHTQSLPFPPIIPAETAIAAIAIRHCVCFIGNHLVRLRAQLAQISICKMV